MTYADEGYYEEKFLLGRKPVIGAGFEFYASQVSQVMDQYTFGRLRKLSEIPEAARMCCCELAEAEYRRERQRKAYGGKTSEKVGTYSVSFASAQESAAVASREQRDIIMKWLADTDLCYQGVD